MTSISNSLLFPKLPRTSTVDRSLASLDPACWSFGSDQSRVREVSVARRSLSVKAGYSDDGRPSNAGIFVGGFVLGGLIVGTLSCVYAPQISKTLAGADRKDLMRKLPKFIYDEEKALEKTRKILSEKIAQLNSAIDGVSAQLRSEDEPNETVVNSEETEAAV